MDYSAVLREFSTLGPALGSVVVVGIICFFLLKLIRGLMEKMFYLFSEHSKALTEIRINMEAHTIIVKKVADNVEANTKATKEVSKFIRKLQTPKKLSYGSNPRSTLSRT